jgi:hypothetical protein
MPTHSRNPSGLADINESEEPFAALFGGSFDQATVESAAELADNSIFVTATGRRFRLQRIPDQQSAMETKLQPTPLSHYQTGGTMGALRRALSMTAGGDGTGGLNVHRRAASHEPKAAGDELAGMMGNLGVNGSGENLPRPSNQIYVTHEMQIVDPSVAYGAPPHYAQDAKTLVYDVQHDPGFQTPLHHSLSISSVGSQPGSIPDYASTHSQTGLVGLSPTSTATGWTSPENGAHFKIDTQTPVVVAVSNPSSMAFSHPPSMAFSDSASTSREGVLPGEELLWEGTVKTSLLGVFEPAYLRVFRNALSHDLRFHCRAGADTETYWIKGRDAQLVPVYAYDARSSLLVYVRDRANPRVCNNGAIGGPNGVYQFPALPDLFRFQGRLTGEEVVLDISSVKWVKLARHGSRASEMYSSARLQIWHEAKASKRPGGDGASFVTAGTALSGPVRDRVQASSSRLMVFLGRAEEHITCFGESSSLSFRDDANNASGFHCGGILMADTLARHSNGRH